MNRILKTIIFLMAMILTNGILIAQSKNCIETAMTQLEMNKCAGIGYKEADAELNRVYNLIRTIYQDDTVFLSKLKNAQRTWIELRDADFELQFPHADEPGYYGSVFPTCENGFKTQITLQRVEFLKRWLVGSEEGEVCSGSIMNSSSIEEVLGN
jgi:uncharacterized protein YecT (DUF1311 family)